jgi:hypothetical protein
MPAPRKVPPANASSLFRHLSRVKKTAPIAPASVVTQMIVAERDLNCERFIAFRRNYFSDVTLKQPETICFWHDRKFLSIIVIYQLIFRMTLLLSLVKVKKFTVLDV